MKVFTATKRYRHGRGVAELKQGEEPATPPAATRKEMMQHRFDTTEVLALYAQRKQTFEPVFGIIKRAMGFRLFSLRGHAKASLGWTLVPLSHNLKRLYHAGARLQSTWSGEAG